LPRTANITPERGVTLRAQSEISEIARSLLANSTLNLDLETAIAKATDVVFEGAVEAFEGRESEIRQGAQIALVGYGALDGLIEDPLVEEIWINSPDQVFISKDSRTSLVSLDIDTLGVRQAVEKMLRDSGRRLDRSQPFVDATLKNGSRLHVVIPDVTREHWAVNIRKFPSKVLNLSDLVQIGALSGQLAEFIRSEYRSGSNILVSGATQAGKTTLLCALLEETAPSERVISVEETFEVRTNHIDWVAMQARQPNLEGVGEISLRRLVREALRMRPTRIVIGEVRQAEALDLLIALNSGIAGLCTIHANSAYDALEKLQLLPLLAGENIPSAFVTKSVLSTIDLVVHARMDELGRRYVAQVIKAARSDQEVKWQEVRL
jgi:pilus assembly protein CpaF